MTWKLIKEELNRGEEIIIATICVILLICAVIFFIFYFK